jgi:hypothetical protein
VVPDCAAMMSRKDSRQALQPWYHDGGQLVGRTVFYTRNEAEGSGTV